jgi:hypothetical protein
MRHVLMLISEEPETRTGVTAWRLMRAKYSALPLFTKRLPLDLS